MYRLLPLSNNGHVCRRSLRWCIAYRRLFRLDPAICIVAAKACTPTLRNKVLAVTLWLPISMCIKKRAEPGNQMLGLLQMGKFF